MTIITKIHKIRSLALAVVKTGKIQGGINALFASFPDIWSVLQPALAEGGLSIGFSNSVISFHGDSEMVAMALEVSDGESVIEREFQMILPEKILNSRGSSVVNNAQRTANAQSYLKRTALIHFFGISAGNEDEVERMLPVGDQSNIPGLITITENTTWQSLTDGLWENVMSPLHDGPLRGRGDKALGALWIDYPAHIGLLAWVADWIDGKTDALGWTWQDLVTLDPSLPLSLTECNASQLRLAAQALKAELSKKKGGDQ